MKSRGFGDTVHKFTTATGIKRVVDKVSEATGKPCGCEERRDTLNRIFAEWRPDLCIIGEPENPTEDFNLRKKSFVKSIEKDFNLPVLNCDETLSSQSVPKNITKDLIDSYSAKIIFDGWFNNK